MPKKKSRSVRKRERQNERRRARNRAVKSAMRTSIKKVLAALQGGTREEVEALLREAISRIHRAASKGVIHRNTAARKVSRLVRRVNAALSPGAGAQGGAPAGAGTP